MLVLQGFMKSSWLWLPPLIILFGGTYILERGTSRWETKKTRQ